MKEKVKNYCTFFSTVQVQEHCTLSSQPLPLYGQILINCWVIRKWNFHLLPIQYFRNCIPRPFPPVPTEHSLLDVSLAIQTQHFQYYPTFFLPQYFLLWSVWASISQWTGSWRVGTIVDLTQWLNRELFQSLLALVPTSTIMKHSWC